MKILLGMSGGLDSTFAAYLLKNMGHDVTGAALHMHEYSDTTAARISAAEVGIPLVVIDCTARFQQRVVEPFMDEYMAARTPNPCVLCNPRVKFGCLCEYAAEYGFDRVSTGHYCGVVCENGRYCVVRAGDLHKDQSYALWGLSQEQLAMLYLPLADLRKDDIRSEAGEIGLSSAERDESQEICFIPDNDYAVYIEQRRGVMPEGDFIAPDGSVCGKHHGLLHYTVGQRKRLGIALGRPVFISRIDAQANRIYLSDSGGEFMSGMRVNKINRQLIGQADGQINAYVKARYAAQPIEALVTLSGEEAAVEFSRPVRAVTPGQSAVFYDDAGRLLFGGFIE